MFVSLEIYSLYPEKFRSTQKHGSVETVERATTKEFFPLNLPLCFLNFEMKIYVNPLKWSPLCNNYI